MDEIKVLAFYINVTGVIGRNFGWFWVFGRVCSGHSFTANRQDVSYTQNITRRLGGVCAKRIYRNSSRCTNNRRTFQTRRTRRTRIAVILGEIENYTISRVQIVRDLSSFWKHMRVHTHTHRKKCGQVALEKKNYYWNEMKIDLSKSKKLNVRIYLSHSPPPLPRYCWRVVSYTRSHNCLRNARVVVTILYWYCNEKCPLSAVTIRRNIAVRRAYTCVGGSWNSCTRRTSMPLSSLS